MGKFVQKRKRMKKTITSLFLLATTLTVNAQVTAGLIEEFKFDGSRVSESGNSNFSGGTVGYGTDRHGNANSAYHKSSNDSHGAIIANLPVGTTSRTVSVWFKPQVVNADNIIFSYGTASGNAAYGASFGQTNMYNFSYSSNLSYVINLNTTDWKHLVVTLETGGNAKMYLNGALVASGNYPLWNTGVSNEFKLGSLFNTNTSSFYGWFDDLKIYNRAIAPDEVAELYNGSRSLITEYDFNNTYNNINGTVPFTSSTSTSFVSDRNGNPESALHLENIGTNAYIENLPNGSLPRTVSIWFKREVANSDNIIFVYGTPSGQQAYGTSYNGSNTFFNFSYVTSISNFYNPGMDWHHLVTTFDATKTAKMYMDGSLVIQGNNLNWNTVLTPNGFWLGGLFTTNGSPFTGDLDELKIFNYALTSNEVDSLYNSSAVGINNLTSSHAAFDIYPNPASTSITLNNLVTGSIIKVLDVTGKLIYSETINSNTKSIETNNWSNGMYFIQIENEGAIAQKKLIINK